MHWQEEEYHKDPSKEIYMQTQKQKEKVLCRTKPLRVEEACIKPKWPTTFKYIGTFPLQAGSSGEKRMAMDRVLLGSTWTHNFFGVLRGGGGTWTQAHSRCNGSEKIGPRLWPWVWRVHGSSAGPDYFLNWRIFCNGIFFICSTSEHEFSHSNDELDITDIAFDIETMLLQSERFA